MTDFIKNAIWLTEKPNGTRVLLDQIRNVGISKESE